MALFGVRAPFVLASIRVPLLMVTTLPILNNRRIALAKATPGVGVDGE